MASSEIPVIGPILSKIFGSRNERIVKRYTSRVDEIGTYEPAMRKLTDAQLKAKLEEFRDRYDNGEKTEDLQVEVFAAAREGMDRAVGIRNIFNPEAGFDPSVLNPSAQKIYDTVQAQIELLEPAPAEGQYLGHPTDIPPYLQVEIPVEL